MSTGAIVGIVVGCLVAIGIIVGVTMYFIRKKKGNGSSDDVQVEQPSQPSEVIQLCSVEREAGSNEHGFETDQEVQSRLAKLSKEEFMKKDTKEYPWPESKFVEVGEEKAAARRVYEQRMVFAYNVDESLNGEKAAFIRRSF